MAQLTGWDCGRKTCLKVYSQDLSVAASKHTGLKESWLLSLWVGDSVWIWQHGNETKKTTLSEIFPSTTFYELRVKLLCEKFKPKCQKCFWWSDSWKHANIGLFWNQYNDRKVISAERPDKSSLDVADCGYLACISSSQPGTNETIQN